MCSSNKERIERGRELARKLEEEMLAKSKAQEAGELQESDDEGDWAADMGAAKDASAVPPTRTIVSDEELQTQLDSLNEAQRRVFDRVVAMVERANHHWNPDRPIKRCRCDDCPSPTPIICTGVAGMHMPLFFLSMRLFYCVNVVVNLGTGKSHLISAIATSFVKKFAPLIASPSDSPTVQIAAPTALAAFAFPEGQTLHKVRFSRQHS